MMYGHQMIKKIVSVFCLIFTDAATIFLSYILAYIIRCHILPTIIPKYAQVPLNPLSFYLKHGYLIIIWLAIFAYEKLYVKRYALWEEVKFIF